MDKLQGEASTAAKCSFCGKNQKQVKKMIAGASVFICNECIDLCNDIIREEMPQPPPLAIAMEEVTRKLYQLGTDVGELAKHIKEIARREGRADAKPEPESSISLRR